MPIRPARLTGQTWCVSFVTLGELTKWTVYADFAEHESLALLAR